MNNKVNTYVQKQIPFRPCITDPNWLVSRWDISDKETRETASFIFGADMVEASVYEKQETAYSLEKLAEVVVTKQLVGGLPSRKCYWFEFDGEKFEKCNEKPEWADYDCGEMED